MTDQTIWWDQNNAQRSFRTRSVQGPRSLLWAHVIKEFDNNPLPGTVCPGHLFPKASLTKARFTQFVLALFVTASTLYTSPPQPDIQGPPLPGHSWLPLVSWEILHHGWALAYFHKVICSFCPPWLLCPIPHKCHFLHGVFEYPKSGVLILKVLP